MYNKTITITISQQQIEALQQLIYLGSEVHSLSHQNEVFTDEEQEAFEQDVENPACELMRHIEDVFNNN